MPHQFFSLLKHSRNRACARRIVLLVFVHQKLLHSEISKKHFKIKVSKKYLNSQKVMVYGNKHHPLTCKNWF